MFYRLAYRTEALFFSGSLFPDKPTLYQVDIKLTRSQRLQFIHFQRTLNNYQYRDLKNLVQYGHGTDAREIGSNQIDAIKDKLINLLRKLITQSRI